MNTHAHTHHTHTHTHTRTPRCSSYDDPSSFKSVSVFSDGSSTGFSPPPSAHAHSLTDGTPPPLPSRDPISPQAAPTPISPQAAPTLGDGYIKMQSAEKRWVWAGRCDQWVWSRMVNVCVCVCACVCVCVCVCVCACVHVCVCMCVCTCTCECVI